MLINNKASDLEKNAAKGLEQIKDIRYDEYFGDTDITKIYHYGIAFHRKVCKVLSETVSIS